MVGDVLSETKKFKSSYFVFRNNVMEKSFLNHFILCWLYDAQSRETGRGRGKDNTIGKSTD